MFLFTVTKPGLRQAGALALCAVCLAGTVTAAVRLAGKSVAASATVQTTIENTQDIGTYFTGYGFEVDLSTAAVDKVKIPKKWDDSFTAFNQVVGESGLTLADYKGKTVEKWTVLCPARSDAATDTYCVLLVYKAKPVGAYLLEKPSGEVSGLITATQTAAEAEQRRDNEHLLGAGVAVLHGDLSAGHAQLVQGTGQGQGLAADAGAGLVGQVLTRAGDGHLDDAGGDGGQDGQQERGDGVGAAFLVIAAAAEDGGELHEVGDADDDRGQHTSDGLDQDVTVGDVADLVGDDAAQLFGAEDAHDAVGDGTTPCSGSRPVAKALGASSGMTQTRGLGMPALAESSATMRCNMGASSSDSSRAWYMESTILSEYQ